MGEIAAVAWEWEPIFKQMRALEAVGANPYSGAIDLRNLSMADAELQPGRTYMLKWEDPVRLAVPLEVLISTPIDPACSDVVVYFHGSSEQHTKAPTDSSVRATIAVKSPQRINGPDEHASRNCFWFHEGKHADWERFDYRNLSVCKELLGAVSNIV